ncbi:MAG: RNA 2',3'-cyclic phosphodiesterase [Sphingomonadaceae bacterium]
MTWRLFVALQPPQEVRDALLGCMGGIEGARWQTDAQLHLTLAFMGEVDRHQAHDIASSLASLRFPPIDVELGHFGIFDNGRTGRVGVLWIGAEPVAPLTELAARVRELGRQAGVTFDRRRFRPHITLARFSAPGAPEIALRRFLTHTAAPVARWTAQEVILFESRLGATGAHYEPLEHYPLG